MAKRASFLYEALGARSRGGARGFGRSSSGGIGRSAQRAARSAAGASSGAFSWLSDLFGGRRRRRGDTGPLLMAVGAGLGLLAAGFLLGRFIGSSDGDGGGALNSSRPSYVMTVQELTTPASDFGVLLVAWPDSEANRERAIRAGRDVQSQFPSARVLRRSNRGRAVLALVVHVDEPNTVEARDVVSSIRSLPFPPTLEIDEETWDRYHDLRQDGVKRLR